MKIQLFQKLITYKTKSADLKISVAMERGDNYLQESANISRSADLVFNDIKAFAKYDFI